MTTIYLIRHAEAEGNLYRRVHGWYDSLITENGYRQIQALERRFASIHVDAVYASDLFRTMTTAKAIYVPKGLELRTDPGLREISMGDWEDQTWGEVRRTMPVELDRFNSTDPTWQAPNGESFAQVGDRVEGTIRRIAARHPGQTIAIFSHGMAIRQVTAKAKGLKPEEWKTMAHSDNTAVTCLEFEDGRFTVPFEGDNSHLDESISTLARQSWWRKDGKKAADVNLWFRPLDMEREEDIYLEARREAWHSIHGDGPAFDGESFLAVARQDAREDPWGVSCAMQGEQLAGIVQLDTKRFAQEGVGYIPFCYIVPGLRKQGLGVQLIGHAVSRFRPLGIENMRLRCAAYNHTAQRFYARCGFEKIGEEQGSRVPLDILEKYIGYEKP